jgi:hypothetical protein
VTFVAVAWNEAERAPALLTTAVGWFTHLTIGVQASTDGTYEVVKQYVNRERDRIIQHPHYGYGERSMRDLIASSETDWVFVVAFDEMPDVDLLQSLESAVAYCEATGSDAAWIPFQSMVEGINYTEQHGHLRLFRRELGWPSSLHSRPRGRDEVWWPYGHIRHVRSLDEMMQDYLRYYRIGHGNAGWDRHNVQMMRDACTAVAERDGWDQITAYEWWPEVRALAFKEETPWLTKPVSRSSRARR